jgi:hypothetical protein
MPFAQQPDVVALASGVRSGSGGIGSPIAAPTWLGAFNGAQTVNHTFGVANSITGTASTACTFSVTPGYSLPAGATLVTVSPTQCRIDFDASLATGTYTFKIRATAP